VIRRPRRSLPATLVAFVLFAAMVLLVTACVQVLVGSPPVLPFTELATEAHTVRWDNVFVLVAGAVLVVLGVVLLACAWVPGVPEVLPLTAAPGAAAGVTRRSLRRNLIAAARRVDGVSGATVTVTGGRVRARVATPLRDASDLPSRVRSALDQRLDAIALSRTPRVSVRVRRDRSAR
jgi:hypothetical protein